MAKIKISSAVLLLLLMVLSSCHKDIYGCLDPTAYNYNPRANVSNGYCVAKVYGCMDPNAFNYNAHANIDNGNCIAKVYGCTDVNATNYNSAANVNDGSCVYQTAGNIIFWTSSGGYPPITVMVNGQSATITGAILAGQPSCGTSGCANFNLPTGTYTYSASNANFTWSGTATVSASNCNAFQLQ